MSIKIVLTLRKFLKNILEYKNDSKFVSGSNRPTVHSEKKNWGSEKVENALFLGAKSRWKLAPNKLKIDFQPEGILEKCSKNIKMAQNL